MPDVKGSNLLQLAKDGVLQRDNHDVASALELLNSIGAVDSDRISILNPKSVEQSDPWSLSGVYGRESFPWHTDGAISRLPPRFVALLALACDADSASTELLDVVNDLPDGLHRDIRTWVHRGADRFGRVYTYRATETHSGERLYRWDERIFAPGSDRAREVSRLLSEVTPSRTVTWQPGRLVIFNNWRFLHRRSAVRMNEKRSIWRAYVS